MYRGSMTGLGLLETTPTGVRVVLQPTCVSQAELDEANAKCPVQQIRGLGAHGTIAMAPMSGRLSGISPCVVADMPVCPAPTCLDPYTAGLVTQCIAGVQASTDFPCNSLLAYALSKLPYCPGTNGGLQPVPPCFDTGLSALRDYCNQHPNSDGPNKALNAGCWAARHDSSYWAQVMAAPACYTQAYVPPAPTTRPPVLRDAPQPPPAPAPVPMQPQSASMAGTWGILALLAAAGGGYYMYRRYKR